MFFGQRAPETTSSLEGVTGAAPGTWLRRVDVIALGQYFWSGRECHVATLECGNPCFDDGGNSLRRQLELRRLE